MEKIKAFGLKYQNFIWVILSIIYVGTLFYKIDFFNEYDGMKPNELGDFLAGVFGPVALLFLILGYFQQSKELKNSSQALSLQADELSKFVAEQEKVTQAMNVRLERQKELREAELYSAKTILTLVFNRIGVVCNSRINQIFCDNINSTLEETLSFSDSDINAIRDCMKYAEPLYVKHLANIITTYQILCARWDSDIYQMNLFDQNLYYDNKTRFSDSRNYDATKYDNQEI